MILALTLAGTIFAHSDMSADTEPDAGKTGCYELGYGNSDTIGDELPASAGDVNVGGIVIRVSEGALRSCALLSDGAIQLLRSARYGHTNDIGDDETPYQ